MLKNSIITAFDKAKKLKKRYKILVGVFFVVTILFAFALPAQLFSDPLSVVIEDRNGNLLAAHIASDWQWRFPKNDSIPKKFKTALCRFEDKRFNYHFGVDVIATLRAVWLNSKHMSVVSGGSTITMQVIRLSRKNKGRTVVEKVIEMFKAVRLEVRCSKDEILNLYAANAPFGGNVVGLDAASWRYFGRSAHNLSWAESAMLAVLPNSPALIHPGKNRKKLLKKRNRLLKMLYEDEVLDKETYELAIDEDIPEHPSPYPQIAPHLLSRVINAAYNSDNKRQASRIKTTIDIAKQKTVNNILLHHSKRLAANHIYNAAAIVIDVESGNVLAYAGNIIDDKDEIHGRKVDIIPAERSTGSILKPFLYASMLSSGEILPDALVPDIPLYFKGYSPKNFDMGYDGAVPARRALARSLNIPAISMLRDYGVNKFHHILRKAGLTSLRKPAEHYGLSLILGGCEGSLWEICGIYSSMARTLNNYTRYNGKYWDKDFRMPYYKFNDMPTLNPDKSELSESSIFSASAIWLTFKAMIDVERPEEDSNWDMFSSNERIAWKTGTSFGFRDAWAVGITPQYVIGVWVGNADGEGRPELVGVRAAAPLLFDIFNKIPQAGEWFDQPYDNMIQATVCGKSGFLASDICTPVDTVWLPQAGQRFRVCPYHKMIHLDRSQQYRVHSDCESPSQMEHVSWFVLPPSIEQFYKSKDPAYKQLPPYRDDCMAKLKESKSRTMELIYPRSFTKIYVPIEIDGNPGNTVFEVAHRSEAVNIFWYIDEKFVGQTKNFHHLPLNPPIGKHILTLVDEKGEKLEHEFEIVGKDDKRKKTSK